MTDTSKYFTDPTEEQDATTLAQARVQMTQQGSLSSMYPAWGELTEHERCSALLDARNYLRAARNAGLLKSRSGQADELLVRIDDLDVNLLRTRRELQHVYEDYDRLERQQGADQLALRHALGIPPGEPWTMTRLIRRVRQVVADLDESRRKAAAATGRALHLAGQINQAGQDVSEEPVVGEPGQPATHQELVTATEAMAGELRV